MEEFKFYDQMIARRDNQDICISPLLSWEFYGEYNTMLTSYREDLKTLKKNTSRWGSVCDYQRKLIDQRLVIIIIDLNLKVIFISHNIYMISGYKNDEVVGKSVKMFGGKDESKEFTKLITKAISNQQSFEVTIFNHKKDNTIYISKIKGFPVFSIQGKLINYIAYMRII